MGLSEDDKKYLLQLSYIYPDEFVRDVSWKVEKMITEQLARGERQSIYDIIGHLFSSSSEETAILENPAAAEAAKEWQEKVKTWLLEGRTALVAGMGPEVVTPLIALYREGDRELAALALGALGALSDGDAVDAFCAAWSGGRDDGLTGVLQRRGYLASKEPRLRLLTLLKTGASREQLALDAAAVDWLLEFLTDADAEVAGRAHALLRSLPEGELTDVLCDRVLKNSGETVEILVREAGFSPQDDCRAALFYCLTGQWEIYWQFDPPPGLLLRRGYAAADEEEQRRLREVLRRGGHNHLLLNLLLAGEGDMYRHLSDDDWSAVAATLQEDADWPEAYRLLTKAPPFWAARLGEMIASAGWQPPQREFWLRLQALTPSAGSGLFVPDGREIGLLRSDNRAGHFVSLAFHPQRQLVAAGMDDGRVLFWRQDTPWPSRAVDMHYEAVSALAFSPDGRQLVTAGREGRVLLWQFPSLSWREAVKGQAMRTEVMALADSGCIRAVSREKAAPVRVWECDDGGIKNRGIFAPALFPCLTLHPDLEYLVSGGVNGMISLYSVNGRNQGRWAAHSAPVRNLAVSGNGRVLASVGADGELACWRLPEGQLLWRSPDLFKVIALALNYQGDVLAVAEDEQVRLLQVFWSKPLAAATHADWNYVKDGLVRSVAPDMRQCFLQELLQEKFQYDFLL